MSRIYAYSLFIAGVAPGFLFSLLYFYETILRDRSSSEPIGWISFSIIFLLVSLRGYYVISKDVQIKPPGSILGKPFFILGWICFVFSVIGFILSILSALLIFFDEMFVVLSAIFVFFPMYIFTIGVFLIEVFKAKVSHNK
ncbi:MAG: hypothetical protein HRU20_20075 [Pseudomonadales bacterium]|nr:hypothetical protein [Pseudomonadales bacterium]